MKTIACWNDLPEFGVIPLTSEACGLSYRLLCDVTARGKRTLEKALGVAELRLHENWNHGSDAEPHVGSIMMAPDILPLLGVFALLEAGCREVWLAKGRTVVGIEESDSADEVKMFKRFHGDDLTRRLAYAGTAGDRNQHVMSGRVV